MAWRALLLGLPRTLAQGRAAAAAAGSSGPGVTRQRALAGETGDQSRRPARGPARRGACAILPGSRQHVANMPRALRVAFLPLALVGPYLRALERPGRDLLREVAEIAPLRRGSGGLPRAHWLGRM